MEGSVSAASKWEKNNNRSLKSGDWGSEPLVILLAEEAPDEKRTADNETVVRGREEGLGGEPNQATEI